MAHNPIRHTMKTTYQTQQNQRDARCEMRETRYAPRRRPNHNQQPARTNSGFAQGTILMLVLVMAGVSLVVLSATINRTSTVATLNERSTQYTINTHAAEAAVEKAIARMSYDFQNYGLAWINANLATYRTNPPTAGENSLWRDFEFSDGQGNINQNYVAIITNYSGPLPSQYPGRTCLNSPVYRVLSNVRAPGSPNPTLTAAVQVDVLAALVPITQWAIFYNGLLEFSSCATMTVNGPVHANGNIYTGSNSELTLNGTLTTTGTQSSPANNGSSSWSKKGTLNGTPKKSENVPTINLSIGTSMNNVHSILQQPPGGGPPTNALDRARLYNLAQVVLLVSNATVTAKIQAAPSAGEVPGSDPSPTIIGPVYRTNLTAMATNFPFLVASNVVFTDIRESYNGARKAHAADVDLAKYKQWITTNTAVTSKTATPTILYVANNTTPSASVLPVVRLRNGKDLPGNGGLGFTVATYNPLYVLGHYNQPNNAHLGTTNTTATVPAALMSDALTILSANWNDAFSANSDSGTRSAVNTTVNAAILTGVMPSTGTKNTQFSGGVHNLPRLLEDWDPSSGKKALTINTSILRLFNSQIATNQFRNPKNFGLSNYPYYDPPTRQFSYDLNFLSYEKTPPGIPTALVLIRKDWATPPPNTVTYYAAP